jgi:hypothetical protein
MVMRRVIMVTPDDVVVPEMEVEEVVEEIVVEPTKDSVQSKNSSKTSKYDAVWESEVDLVTSTSLRVYTFSGERAGVGVGPFKVVAPDLYTAAELMSVFSPELHHSNVFNEES